MSEARTETHWGVRDTAPDGVNAIADYEDDEGHARQAATMTPLPGHRLEAGTFTVSYGAFVPVSEPQP